MIAKLQKAFHVEIILPYEKKQSKTHFSKTDVTSLSFSGILTKVDRGSDNHII